MTRRWRNCAPPCRSRPATSRRRSRWPTRLTERGLDDEAFEILQGDGRVASGQCTGDDGLGPRTGGSTKLGGSRGKLP